MNVVPALIVGHYRFLISSNREMIQKSKQIEQIFLFTVMRCGYVRLFAMLT